MKATWSVPAITRMIPAWAILWLIAVPTHAKYGGGDGTAADPYQIWTAEQMNAIGAEPNDWDKHFKLMADIDLSAYDGKEGRPVFRIIAVDVDSEDPTSRRDLFTGVFDGNGRTISNFTHASTDRYRYAGLFGYVAGPTGEVRNLGLIDAAVDVGAGWSVGALVGSNAGVVLRCYSMGSVAGKRTCVGGLVGYNYGAVVGCYSTAAVGGNGSEAGGLVGCNDEGTLVYSYGMGPVSGTRAGGLVGYNWGGDLIHCYSTGPVSGVTGSTGGLVGVSSHSIYGDDATISCFWDVQTSGQDRSPAGTGLTTAQMQDARTFLQAGWDWAGAVEDGTSEVWGMPESGGYPVLASVHGYTPVRLRGDGTPGSPYAISNALELGAMAHYSPGAHYRLVAPIDLSGIRWRVAVVPCLLGTFDGGGLTISRLTVTGDSHLGLFGRLRHEAQVANLGVVDVNVTGGGIYNGGLAACNEGVVIRCFSTGSVRGGLFAGGFVGLNRGVVTDCYSTTTVSGERYCGGLLGSNLASVTHCYSVGALTASGSAGYRLVGAEGGAEIGCFWEPSTSSSPRIGRSPRSPPVSAAAGTAMQDQQTYLDAGWDWVDETANGTSEVWRMPEGGGYPVLAIFEGYKPLRLRGQGTPADPHLMSNALEFGAATYHSPCAHYRLAARIDLSGIRWAVSLIPSFRGVFDGNGHAVSHLTITGGGYLGLFGMLQPGAEVLDLGVVDCNIAGSGREVGGLAGSNGGVIRRCYSTGAVNNTGQYVGGLVGSGWGNVIQCFSTCRVTGQADAGGLIGLNSGILTDCYSSGAVDGTRWVGGLVGDNLDAVVRCYSVGAVRGTEGGIGGLCGSRPGSDVAGCFWDVQTSGQTASYGGTGKTTVEMLSASTYLNAGWDFVGETANGTEDIWWIDEGRDYPWLWWEAAELTLDD